MLAVVVSILAGLGGAFALWQALVRWRAHGTAEVRALVAEMRTTFYDITAHGSLDSSKFLSGDRHTLESRFRDRWGQLHDRVLRDRVDHLLLRWREVFAASPAPIIPAARGSRDGPVEWISRRTPDDEKLIRRQVESARAGLVEVESVLDRCNQLDGPIVWS